MIPPPILLTDTDTTMPKDRSTTAAAALGFGIASLVLYVLLLANAELFVDWARRTREGETLLFAIPIVVAFLFSWVHGAFTGHFWEALGVQAAKSGRK